MIRLDERWLRGVWGRLGETVAAERDRWLLWLPVSLALGIGLYFSVTAEPPWWLGPAALAAALALLPVARRRTWSYLAGLALCALSLGFLVAQTATWRNDTVMLDRRYGPVAVEGVVAAVDLVGSGQQRVLLSRPAIGGLASADTPRHVRLRLPRKTEKLQPGDRLRLRAVLLPIPPPAMPGGFDFQQRAYFQGLGATGFAFQARKVASAASDGGFATWLARLRARTSDAIRRAVPGAPGAIAAALLTGDRSAIPPEALQAMRDAGLAHLLAISGLHLGLVAGFFFVAVRACLALLPWLAVRVPIKKWAATVALVGAFAYLLLSGATVPTQRAFVMVAIVMLGVTIDRVGISMRLVAVAATVLLLLAPESLLSASFQLSFAAVVALVAVYETMASRGLLRRARDSGPLVRAGRLVGATALTSVVAGAATAPFALYHFGRLAAYGLLANLIAVPMTAMVIMPAGLIGLVLLPVGLGDPALAVMGWGIEAVLAVAEWVQGLPGSVHRLPAITTTGLLLVTVGGLWLCLWTRRWRLGGVVPILAGFAVGYLALRPDILISSDGRLMALHPGDGRLWLSTERRARFVAKVWRERLGLRSTVVWPAAGKSALAGRLACGGQGCLLTERGATVAFPEQPAALAEDCWRASLIVAAFAVRQECPAVVALIDARRLRAAGSHVVWLRRGGPPRLLTDLDVRGVRPWVVRGPGSTMQRLRRTWPLRPPTASDRRHRGG